MSKSLFLRALSARLARASTVFVLPNIAGSFVSLLREFRLQKQ